MGKPTTLLIAFFIASVALAASLPFDLQDVVIKDKSSAELSAKDQGLIDVFLAEVDRAQPLIAQFPTSQTHLKIIELNSSIKSQYYQGKISIQTACQNKIRLESIKYLPVLLHEYAHTLFEANLEHYLGAEKLESIDNDKKFDDGEKTPNWGVQVGIIELAAAYNELFADVYTVMALNNPTAMSDFFLECNELENHRNFSWTYNVDPENPIANFASIFYDVHNTFDPVRTFVWKKYSLSSDINIRAKLVHAVFMASQETIAELYHRKLLYKEWSQMDLVQMNSDLILRINQHLNN